MENKKKLEVIFSLFIGVLFISSYAVFANLNNTPSRGNTNTTATSPSAQTIYLTSVTNALIENYTGTANIYLNCKNLTLYNATASNITSILTTLESNNSVSTFYQSQRQFYIDLGNFAPISLYNFFSKNLKINEKSCLNFNATAQLLIPSYVNFTVKTGTSAQKVPISIPSTTRTIYLNVSIPSNSLFVPVTVAALVYSNGTVYQLSVTHKGV